jgi:selenocysteine lyase/cysteine desulfurase
MVSLTSAGLVSSGKVPAAGSPIGQGLRTLADELDAAGDDRARWGRVRREFALHPGIAYLNTGTLGACPRVVLSAVSEALVEIEGNPANMVFGPVGARMEAVRSLACSFLGAGAGEVILTRNTTEGMNWVAEGIAHELRPGDEILTTDREHPGGLVGWQHVAERHGARVVTLSLPAPPRDEEEILQRIEDHLTPKTRIVSLSHVETITGLVLPLARIAQLTRPRGILLACDGAQAPGMLAVDVQALGVDTYASSSHKWALAPKGSGLLYIRPEALDRIRPAALHSGLDAYTASSGTRNVASILGHGTALAFIDTIGRQAVEARCRALNAYLRDRLDPLPGLTPLSPTAPSLSSAISSYKLERGNNAEVADRLLREFDLVVKVVPGAEWNGLRFSTHIYNDEGQIDRLADAIGTILGA